MFRDFGKIEVVADHNESNCYETDLEENILK